MPAALPSLRDFRSAVIIKPSSLGDIVHTLPAVKALRETHPHLKIRWLANTEWMPILQGSSLIDEVIPFPRKTFRGLAGLLRFWNWRRTFLSRIPSVKSVKSVKSKGLKRDHRLHGLHGLCLAAEAVRAAVDCPIAVPHSDSSPNLSVVSVISVFKFNP